MAENTVMKELKILSPSDFHHHFRDGEVLTDLVQLVTKRGQWKHLLAMPNTIPPIKTPKEAELYHQRIIAAAGIPDGLQVHMTLYLTDDTTVDDILQAAESPHIIAVKLYPAGVTTNSSSGVTDLSKLHDIFEAMSHIGLPLCIHGEVNDPTVDIFDREAIFIETILKPLIHQFPHLKIVLEHITTKEAVEFIQSQQSDHIVATITAHHLLYNRNALFSGGICPHKYCLPILKRESHRLALLQAVSSGSKRFFAGSDSAPHMKEMKENSCGCAGIFTGHAAVELYTEAFESVNALDKLEGFLSIYGAQFYGLSLPSSTITLVKESWEVPESYPMGSSVVIPLKAGEMITWRLQE